MNKNGQFFIKFGLTCPSTANFTYKDTFKQVKLRLSSLISNIPDNLIKDVNTNFKVF